MIRVVLPQSASRAREAAEKLAALPGFRIAEDGYAYLGESPIVISNDSKRALDAAQAKRERRALRR